MVKLVYRQKAAVELLVADFLHAVAQGGMGAYEYLAFVLAEELHKQLRLALLTCSLVFSVAEIIAWRHLPVGEEAVLNQVGVFK